MSLKLAPLLVLALIWLWLLVAVLIIGTRIIDLKPLLGWGILA